MYYINNGKLIEYGTARKDLRELTENDLKNAHDKIYKQVRERARAVGPTVYYMIDKLMIA